MAVIVNGDGILTGISSLATSLTDITSGRGTITGVTTVGTLQLGAGVSISSPRTQNAAIFTNNTEFFTVDDAGRVGVGTITPNSDAHPENEKKINVGFITAKSIAGDIDARNVVVAGVTTFVDDVKFDGATAGRDITFDRSDNQLEFEDNAKAAFGTGGADMQIYSDGTNPIIYAGTNTLRVVADNIHLEAGDFGDEFLRCNHDGSVALYYDNDNTFSTSTSGVDVKVTSTDTSTPPDKYLLVYNANDGANTMAGIRFVATSNSSSDHYIFQKKHGSGTGADLVISQNTSERARFTEHGGINFNGDTASANALDDYEEGTWTPAFSAGETCTNNQSTYTRIGRLVVTNCYISNFSNFDGNNNEFRITGLPFPAHNAQGGSYHGGGYISYAASWNYSYPLLPLVGSNNNYIYFHRQDGTASSWKFQDFHNTGLSSGGALIVQMIYETDY